MLDFSTKMNHAEALALVKLAEQERARYVAATFKALFGWLGNVVAAIAEAKEASRLYTELSRMSDRQLDDLGITRSEIPAFVGRALNHTAVHAEAANDDAAEAVRQAA